MNDWFWEYIGVPVSYVVEPILRGGLKLMEWLV